MSDLICPDCGHDIELHEGSGCFFKIIPPEYSFRNPHKCGCKNSIKDCAEKLLAERDQRSAAQVQAIGKIVNNFNADIATLKAAINILADRDKARAKAARRVAHWARMLRQERNASREVSLHNIGALWQKIDELADVRNELATAKRVCAQDWKSLHERLVRADLKSIQRRIALRKIAAWARKQNRTARTAAEDAKAVKADETPALPPVEVKHPTYGTLFELLEEIQNTVRSGELPRIGHHGALAWFADQYARAYTEPSDAEDAALDHAIAVREEEAEFLVNTHKEKLGGDK